MTARLDRRRVLDSLRASCVIVIATAALAFAVDSANHWALSDYYMLIRVGN